MGAVGGWVLPTRQGTGDRDKEGEEGMGRQAGTGARHGWAKFGCLGGSSSSGIRWLAGGPLTVTMSRMRKTSRKKPYT